MKKIIFLVITVIMLLSCNGKTSEVVRTVDVSGYGSIEVEPDYVTLELTISTVDLSPRESQSKNQEDTQSTIDILKSNGVEDKWISTMSYNLSEYSEYNHYTEMYEFKGYRTTHQMQVRIVDLVSVPEVFSSILETGVSKIGSIEYGVNNYIDTQNQVLAIAVEAARVKAETMVLGEDLKVGSLITLTTNSQSNSGVGGLMMQNMTMDSFTESSSAIATGSRFVRATVYATFELVKK